jgi:hypothetical protein
MADIDLKTEIAGRHSVGNIQEEAYRKMRSEVNRWYDSATAITVPNASADVDIISFAGGSGLFTNVPIASIIEIYTNANISIKLRTQGNTATATASLHSINIRANTLRTLTQVADVTAIYVSNASGGAATVECLLT